MGYSGYTQRVCENGHWAEEEHLLAAYGDPSKCHICDSEIVWQNDVDNTNGDDYGIVPPADYVKEAGDRWEKTVFDPDLGQWITTTEVIHAVYEIPPDDAPRYRRYQGTSRVDRQDGLVRIKC